ncbi:MAG TPA: hypothetical protein DCQ83_05320, partial [Fibrobacteres bacterium]|nr:hypothetical protein [Fibrobacterota bacterium]
MLKTMLPLVLSGLVGIAAAQPAQITVTNVAADSVLKGLYNRSRYQASTAIDKVSDIAPDMFQQVSADSLSSYLNKLVTFYNRNSGSDTVSTTTGIGAARRWVYSKFQEFSAQSGNRLLPSYLQFNQTICSVARHRDIFAVLPGRDTSNHSILIVEGHMDSRCENNCDITCKAHGADDNGSGTVLTMELARVLSKYTFNQTLVFLVTMGEEQSLYGANAFATYCKNSSIPVKAVQNNDVVGGIICGPSSSPPSCPTKGAKDSTHIRIFSLDTNFSMHKAYARFVKGQYEKWLKPTAPIPMEIMIMSPVDRTGRGGDHQPFSDIGMTAVRFTESYENGNGGATSGRQHTTRDVISEGDTMFVNFEYLRRNTQINAIGLIGAALGPQSPDLTLTETTQHNVQVTVTGSTSPVGTYKIAVRTTGNNDFAVVYTLQGGTTFLLPNTVANTTYYVAVA